MKEDIIIDDLGCHWRWSPLRGKILCIEAEDEMRNDPNITAEERLNNGYYADNFDDGVSLLYEYGYITKKDKLD